MAPAGVVVRRARTADVRAIRALVAPYVNANVLLAKAPVSLYEDVQEFWVAVDGDEVVACGALHVLWEDLAEIRTLAVAESRAGMGFGARIVEQLLMVARELGVARVFVLTFETRFFSRFGFREIDGTPVTHDVFDELLQSFDQGVAEFLDLERVKPNTLGNARMLLDLGVSGP